MGAAKQQAPALSALSCSLSALSCSLSEEMPWQQLRQAATLTLSKNQFQSPVLALKIDQMFSTAHAITIALTNILNVLAAYKDYLLEIFI